MTYAVREVDGVLHADTIERFNAMAPDAFPSLEARHYADGYWWLTYWRGEPVAFAGLVPFEPFEGIGYCKRCLVTPDHYGHGLQSNLLRIRIEKAQRLGWWQLVSDCAAGNSYSAGNFRKAGFRCIDPEQRWAGPTALYWSLDL